MNHIVTMRLKSFLSIAALWLLPAVFCQAATVQSISLPAGAMAPDARVDSSGAIHVAYVAGENVFYIKSSDNGKSFTSPVRVNSEPDSSHAGMFRGPELAIGKNGRVHIIWYGNGYQRKLPKDDWGVFYSHSDSDKGGFIPAQNLNHKPSDNYSLAADGRGSVAVFWMAGGLFLTSSADDGNTFATGAKIEGPETCECCASRALYGSDGTLFCAYREKANNIRDMHLAVRAPNQDRFITEKISMTPWEIKACPMTGTSLSQSKSGLVMAWETKGQIYFTRLSGTAGKPPGTEIRVERGVGKWPVALSSPDGSALVSWKKDGSVKWRLYDRADHPVGDLRAMPVKSSHRHAAVVTKEGNFLVLDELAPKNP